MSIITESGPRTEWKMLGYMYGQAILQIGLSDGDVPKELRWQVHRYKSFGYAAFGEENTRASF